MPQITSQTLVVAIQAVDAEVRALRDAVLAGDAEPEEHQLLEDRMRAAEDLEHAYNIEARTVINLPPYDQLVGG